MEKLLKMSSKFPEISIKAWSLTPSSAFGPVEIHPDNRLSCRKQLLWQNSGTSSSLFVFYWNMCFYIICSIHMRATQLSQCTFCDPSVRLQEQRKEWHFSQALTAPDSPLLLKTGALPCQKSHPLESRQREVQSILIPGCLMLTQSPDQIPETPVRGGLSTFHIFHPKFCFSRGLLEAAARCWGDGCCPPASWFCCTREPCL